MSLKNKQFYYKDYYRQVDGLYHSYWLSKFINNLMYAGHKQTSTKLIESAFGFLKVSKAVIPIKLFLETLEKNKPIFNLSYAIVRGKKREFPRFLSRHRQFHLSVRWLGECVLNRKEWYLNQRVFNEFLDVGFLKKRHPLVKRRNELLKSAIVNRFNTRFSY